MREHTDKIKFFSEIQLEKIEKKFDDWYAFMSERYSFEVKHVEFKFSMSGGPTIIAMCWYRIHNIDVDRPTQAVEAEWRMPVS